MSNNPYFFQHGQASNAPSPGDTEVISLQKINALLAIIAAAGGGGGGYAPYASHASNFSALAGGTYGVDTTAGPVTVTPPSAPSAGDWFRVFDLAKKWATNQCVVGASGNNFIDLSNPTPTAGPYDLNAVPYIGQGFITFVWNPTLSAWSVN